MATGTYSITAGLSAEILANSVRAVMAWGRSRLLDLTEEQLLEKITLNHRVLVNRMRMFCLDAAQCRSVAADNTWAMLGSLKEHIIDECENSSSGIGNYSSRQDAVGGGPTGAGTGSVGGDSYEAEHAQCENEFESIEIPSEVYLEGKLVRGLRMNMGCEMSVVHSDHVPVTAFTGGTLTFASRVGGQISSYRLPRISIRIGPAVVQHEVAVANDLDCPALLGSGVMKPLLRVLLAERKAQAKENDCIDVVVAKQEEEEPSLISGVHEVQQYVDGPAHDHGSLKPDGTPVGLKKEEVPQEVVCEHAQLFEDASSDGVVAKQEEEEPSLISGVHEVQQYVDELAHGHGSLKPDGIPVVLEEEDVSQEAVVEHAQLGYDVVVTKQEKVEPGVVSGVHEVQQYVDELEHDQGFPKADDTPVILGNVFEFSDDLFSSDAPVGLGEVFELSDSFFEPEDPVPTPVQVLEVCPVGGAGSSCFSCNDSDVEVILREDCVAVQPLDDLFEFSVSLVSYDSLVGLGDVLDILDQLFVPMDPVPTPVKVLEVCPEGGADVEYPLPMLKEGGAGRTCIDCKNSDDELMVLEDCVVEQSLGDVFDFSDGLYESEDPVPTSVKVLEVCPVDWSNTEYPLPRLKEGGTGGACIVGKASMEEVIFVEDSVVVQPLDHFICVQMEENVIDCGDSVNLVEDSVVVQPLGDFVRDQTEVSGMDYLDGSDLVEESVVVQPLGVSVYDQKEESVMDFIDGSILVEECVVGPPLVDFVSVENEAFGSVVLHSLLDGMAENLGSAVDPLVEEKVVPMCPQDMGGTPVLVVPSVDACAENDDVFVEGYQKIYDPGAEMLVGLRSSSSLETLCMVSVEGEAIPDNSVSVWLIPYRVKDRGKDAKSEGFGSSVWMGVACHGFCAWAAALHSLETRWLHLGSLEITKATSESSPEEVAWCAFILLTVISVFECFCSVPLFTIPTTDWADFSMSGATCDSPVAVLCAVEKQEKRLAVFFLILVQLFIVYQWLRIETETAAHECAEMPDENCCDLPPVGCQTLPLHLRPLVKRKEGEMLWSPPLRMLQQPSKHQPTCQLLADMSAETLTQLVVIIY